MESYHMNGWTKEKWCKACGDRIARLYIIRCFNDNESFYKIGITCKSLKDRLGYKSRLPYNYELLLLIQSKDAQYIYDLESKLHRQHLNELYTPLIQFKGDGECFINYIKSPI